MHDFRYVTKNEAKPIKEELYQLLYEVQDLARDHFTFKFTTVGSSSHNMITYDANSNIGFDFDCSFKDESVELLLKTSKSEYENEHNRTSIIDSKTNISLPIISAFFLALIQLNDYKAIFRLPTCTFLQWLLPATLFITYTAALILGLLSVFLMTRVSAFDITSSIGSSKLSIISARAHRREKEENL